MYHGGMELYQRMYDDAGYNVKVLIAGVSTPRPPAGSARRSATSPRSGQMRIAGLGGRVLGELGTTMQMPGGEIFQNLDTGKIDGRVRRPPPTRRRPSTASRPSTTPVGISRHAVLLLINKDAWNVLTPASRR